MADPTDNKPASPGTPPERDAAKPAAAADKEKAAEKKPAATSPAADKPAQAAERKSGPPSGRRRSPWATLLWLLTWLLIAALVAVCYYLWTQFSALRAEQAQLVPVAVLERHGQALNQTDAELRSRLDSVAQDAALAQRSLIALQQELGSLKEGQQALSQAINVEVKTRRGEWIRAEAAYLANVAVYRLRFNRDVDGALEALKLADQLLSRLDSASIEARRAVNQAINRLVAVDTPQVEALAGRLEALIGKVDLLPLDLQIREADAADAAQAAEPDQAQDWQENLKRAWARFTETLGELVVVRRDRQVEPLLAPEERYFLYHNLRLRLEAARLALIDRNAELYGRSLDRAAEWIDRYYARGEPEVVAALTEIRSLRQVAVDPELPQIAPLLQPVTDY